MKACRFMKIMVASIFGLLIAAPNLSFGQDEYDDLYFTPKDRKEVKYEADYNLNVKSVSDYDKQTVAKNTETSDIINPTYSPSVYGDLEENYSSKNVNPEYIARYKSNPKDASSEEIIAEGDSYYEEDYLRSDLSEKGTIESSTDAYSYPSTFYGACDPRMRSSMYGSSFYDPFMGGGFSPGWNIGLGYSFGYMPGFNMSIGYGSGYNPWYSPFYSGMGGMAGMSRFYNPYYSPWAYDPMYSSMGYGYGGPGYYNPYGMYNDPYAMYNNGMYSGRNSANTHTAVIAQTVATPSTDKNAIINPTYRNRVSRGSDVYSRDNIVTNSRTESQDRISAQDNESTVNARTASDKDYSGSQNEYYNTRSASRNGNTAYASSRSTDRSTLNTRSVSGNTVGTSTSTSARVRSSRNTSSDYSRPSYRSAKSSSTSYNSLGRSSSSNNSYKRSGSSTGSSSYSSGSSFRSSGSSSGSRSSGSSSGSSSGGSRSGSSGGGSRSSGRGN